MGFGKPGLCREQPFSDSTGIITGLGILFGDDIVL